MKMKCPICREFSFPSEWKVEYSDILDWPVIVCPECGDGLALDRIIKETTEDMESTVSLPDCFTCGSTMIPKEGEDGSTIFICTQCGQSSCQS